MSTKTQKGARSGRTANVAKAAQGAPDPKDEPVAEVTAHDATPAAADAPVAKKGGKGRKGEATLGDVAEGYLAHLADEGKSEGTIFSYGMDLKIALDHFGPDTPVSAITPAKLAAFYESDAVMKKRNGRKKSSITIAKTCRVLRLALVWAAEKGLIEKAPIPAPEKAETKTTAKA